MKYVYHLSKGQEDVGFLVLLSKIHPHPFLYPALGSKLISPVSMFIQSLLLQVPPYLEE